MLSISQNPAPTLNHGQNCVRTTIDPYRTAEAPGATWRWRWRDGYCVLGWIDIMRCRQYAYCWGSVEHAKMARVEEQNHENQLTFLSPNEVNLKVDDFLYTVYMYSVYCILISIPLYVYVYRWCNASMQYVTTYSYYIWDMSVCVCASTLPNILPGWIRIKDFLFR